MPIYMISRVIQKNKLIGVGLLDDTNNQYKIIPSQAVVQALKSNKITIENLTIDNGELRGSNGSLDRYPIINQDGSLRENNSVIILNELTDGDKTIGHTVSDYKGTILKVKNQDLIKYIKTKGVANGKLVSREGTEFISSIIGEYKKIDINSKKRNNKNDSSNKSSNMDKKIDKPIIKEPEVDNTKTVEEPIIHEEKYKETKSNTVDKTYEPDVNLSKTIVCDNGMTVEQKLARSVLKMKATHAFYFAIYSLLKRIESEDLPTMGVTATELHYNPKFVAELDESELNFINLHEVCHVAMIHSVRGKGKNHTIFNVACDYYVNKVLCEEFTLVPGREVVINGVSIKCPSDLLYNDNVDIVKDTPEIIYEELMQSIEKNNPSFLGQGQDQGNQRNSPGGSGGSGENKEDEENNGDNQDGSGGEGKNKEDNIGKQSKGQGNTGEETGEQSGGGNSGTSKGNDAGQGSGDEVECDFRGDKIKIKKVYTDLIIDDSGDKSKEAHQGKTLVERARLKSRGVGGCQLERLVEEILAPKIDWKRLFRNQLKELNVQISTFSSPDRRYLGRGMYMPGPKKLEAEKLKGVKVCIDTSGSMTANELGECFTQVKDMLKTFELDAEVIYWDWEIENKDKFKSLKEFRAIKPKGGGGTNPSCVFEYFESRECKDKPSVVIMFTDGEFGEVKVSSKRKYKDTIWVIKNNKGFTAPFGKVAPLKIDI